jgi:long-chain-fatty-acid--CoA ligase ACSBG
MFFSGIGCGMYATNTAEACEYILKDTNAQIVVVENKQQLEKIIKCKNNNTPIKKIIQYSGSVDKDHDGLVMSVSFDIILNYFVIFVQDLFIF